MPKGVYERTPKMRKDMSKIKTGKRKYKVEPKVCPVCGIIFPKPTHISYKNWKTTKCCSNKCAAKLRPSHPCSEKTRKLMSETMKNGYVWNRGYRKYKTKPKICPICGIIFEKSTRITPKRWKNQICCSGLCKYEYYIGENHPTYNRKFTKEEICVMREKRILDIETKFGICFPNYNKKACELFKQLNKNFNLNLRYAENSGEVRVLGYFLDAFDFENNLIIEYDERRHNNSTQKIKDEIRQSNIIEKTGFTFIRIKENTTYEKIVNNMIFL